MDFLTTTVFSGGNLDIVSILLAVFTALVLGIAIAVTYMLTRNKEFISKSQTMTLVMLPPIIAIIVAIVVPIVGNNLASAFSIAGVFTIIRFRSIPAEPIDVAYVAFALAAGLSCGLGYLYIGMLFTVLMIIALFILKLLNFASPKNKFMLLKITVPEDLNFENSFDDILKKYTEDYSLQKIKTCDFGSLFEISYKIKISSTISKKSFMDELRTVNGNLNIVLTQKEFENA